MSEKIRIKVDGAVAGCYLRLKGAIDELGAYNQKDDEIALHLSKAVRRSGKKEKESLKEKARSFFNKNWRYLVSFFLPPVFYGFCILGGEIEGALATSTAVILAGCVSMIVLQENKKIEDLKLNEKWIYEVRELVSEYSFLASGVLSTISEGCRKVMGYNAFHISDREDERVKLIKPLGLDKLFDHIDVVFRSSEYEKLERTYKKLELMLESNERSDFALCKLKMLDMSISHAAHIVALRNEIHSVLSVKSLSILSMKGANEVSGDIRRFLDYELSRSKRGSVEVRRNIRALYYGIVSVVLSFIGYIVLKSFVLSAGEGGVSHTVLWLIPSY